MTAPIIAMLGIIAVNLVRSEGAAYVLYQGADPEAFVVKLYRSYVRALLDGDY